MKDHVNTRAQFQGMLNLVYETLGKDKPEARIVRAYFDSLKGFSIEEIAEALNRHMVDPDRGQWVPKPADIVRQIMGNTESNAELAWTLVDQAIRQVGPWQSVCFDNPISMRVIHDMGGWVKLCNTDEKNYPFVHKEFITRFRGYANRPTPDYPGKLIGSAEAHNAQGGHRQHNELVFIGDPQAAEAIHLSGQQSIAQITRAGDLTTGLLEEKGD